MEIFNSIQEYAEKMRHIQEILIEFFEDETNQETDLKNIIKYFDDHKTREDKHELKEILHLIFKIADNHHRSQNFFHRIEQILNLFTKEIKTYYTNFEIFSIFKENKRILLYLFNEKIIIPDKLICWVISNEKFRFYPDYFYPEFKSFFSKKMLKTINTNNPEFANIDIEAFNRKRECGENDNYICQLIREDSVEEFIAYVNRTNFSLKSKINVSIFETNSMLLQERDQTLIEYAAFFGSMQIFKYLQMNDVEMPDTLWIYAIHGQNAELIHLLEENHVKKPKYFMNQLYKESSKCHHIHIANYIKDDSYQDEEESNLKLFSFCLSFYNFADFCDQLNVIEEMFKGDLSDNINQISDVFYEFCKNDCYPMVELLINKAKINFNFKKILILIIVMIFKIIYYLLMIFEDNSFLI